MVFAFKEPVAPPVCHFFGAFSIACILLELEMISFPTIIFKLFFRVAGLAHLLRMVSCFYSHFLNWVKGAISFLQVSLLIIFDQCPEQLWHLFQVVSVVFSQHSVQYFLVVSLYCCEDCSVLYLILSPVSVFLKRILQHTEEEQSHFIIVLKTYQH